MTTHSFLQKYYQHALDYTMALLVFFVPLTKALPNIFLIPAGLLFIYKIYYQKKIEISMFWALNLCLVLCLLFLATTQGDFITELAFQEKLIAGLLVFLIMTSVSNKKMIEQFFLSGILIIILINSVLISYNYLNGIPIDLSFGKSVNSLLLIERPYFAFLSVLANYIVFKWIRAGQSKLFYVVAVLSGSFCFFIAAKLGMILHILLLLYHTFKMLKSINFKHLVVFSILISLLVIVIIKNPYLKERLRIESNIENTIRKFKAYEIRFIVWECNVETLKEHWISGLKSHSNLIPTLTSCYESQINPERTKKISYYRESKFNTHNQYFDVWLTGGLVAIALMTLVVIFPMFNFENYKNMIPGLVLLLIFMLVENIWQRQMGCFIYSIFLGLYVPKDYSISWSRNNKTLNL